MTNWPRGGYPAGDTPASELKPPPTSMVSKQRHPATDATYTAAEVKVLTETASKVALELGREESRAELEALRALWWFLNDEFDQGDPGDGGPYASVTWASLTDMWDLHDAVEVLYQDGGYPPKPSSQLQNATSDATSVPSEGPWTSEPSKAAKTPQEDS